MEREALSAFLERQLAERNLPSLCVVAVGSGEVLYSGCHGLRNLQTAEAATEETLYPISSIAKAVTALALLRLEDEGKLAMDDPVEKHFPGLRAGKGTTLEHLVSHSSGLPLGPCSFVPFELQDSSREAVLGQARAAEPFFPPGSRFKYSNLAFAVAAEVVERVSGRPFREWVEERVLKPAGMADSAFLGSGSVLRPVAAGYHGSDYGALIRPWDELEPAVLAAGPEGASNLMCTLRDLENLLKSLLREGSLLERLGRPVLRVQRSPRVDFGLGLRIGRRQGHRCLEQLGAGPGFSSRLALLPEAGLGVALLVNRCWAHEDLREILEGTLGMLLGGSAPARAGAGGDGTQDAGRDRLCGRYGSPRGTLEVRRRSEGLEGLADGQAFELVPRSPASFYQRGGPWSARLLRFHPGTGPATACSAGALRFRRGSLSEPGAEPGPGWRSFEGAYHASGFGGCEVVAAKDVLLAALTATVVVKLEPVGKGIFRVAEGPLYGEPVHFFTRAGRVEGLEALSLGFQKLG